MKKILFLLAMFLFGTLQAYCETDFINALNTCASFTQTGAIPYGGQVFNIMITLQKSKGKCLYKEKIYQDIGYEQLACSFDNNQLKFISDSMKEFTETFKKEISKNKIFEAKLSSNGVVFQKYLVEPKYCQITHFKK